MPMRPTPEDYAGLVIDRIGGHATSPKRVLIAIAGPPASGKSTLAAAVVKRLNAAGGGAVLLPMDGFHLDNSILRARGLQARKGAPETFDLPGFASLMARLQTESDLYAPSFDRERDVSVGSSVYISGTDRIIVVEGNYLLLDQPGWRALKDHWAFSVFVEEDLGELRKRLIGRWLKHGFSREDAIAKAELNDLPNAQTILQERLPADLVLKAS